MKLPSLKEGVKAANVDLDTATLPQMIINRCGASSRAKLAETNKNVKIAQIAVTEE